MSSTSNRDPDAYTIGQVITELSEEALRNLDNLPAPVRNIGRPRLCPFKAALYNFYEPLVLFEILQRILGCSKLAHSSELNVNERFGRWRRYVNQLSWLCDYKNGGDTSSVISVEATTTGPKYWVVANFDPKHKGPSHLRTVLQKLSALTLSPAEAHRPIFDEILQGCLSFSSKKFDNYRRRLLKNINNAKRSLGEMSNSPEIQLLLDLSRVSEEQDPYELATFAFRYVKSDTVRMIYAKHRNKAPRQAGSAWFNICHYIGRLGAWTRALRVVVRFAKDHPEVLGNFQVDFKTTPKPIKPPPPDQRTTLEGLLKRMLPRDIPRAQRLLTRIRSAMAPGIDIDEEFVRKYKSKTFTPRSHAELLLHEHFSTQKLTFFYNDEFVGGSKPSCYCCNLYFEFHAGGIVTRPTHGNVWHKWCLPPGLMQINESKFGWEARSILKRMTRQIRSDILELVESGLPHRARMQDSTTGFWTAQT